MTDSLGWRQKFAVLIPSTNTSVQPEFDAMRPPGVTNHVGRIRIPNMDLKSNEDFSRLIELIAAAQDEAVDSVMTCEPDRIVLGISAETFWDGAKASRDLKRHLEERTRLPVTVGAEACEAAFRVLGMKSISVVTPYQPVGDRNVVRFFEEVGFTVKRIKGLRCESPVKIAHVSKAQLRDAFREVDGDDIDGIVQVGTNLAAARLAGQAEVWMGKPVVAINTAIYWSALRESGIDDRVAGFGALLERH